MNQKTYTSEFRSQKNKNSIKFRILPSFIPRSWISSTIICVTPFKFLSESNFLNNIPVVQKRRWVSLPFIPSRRTLYPTFKEESQQVKNIKFPHKKISIIIINNGRHKGLNGIHSIQQLVSTAEELTDSPNFSPLSKATLSETEMAEMRLGCVHITLQRAPRTESISDSKMNWGICVVFPQPVSPEMITTCKLWHKKVTTEFKISS